MKQQLLKFTALVVLVAFSMMTITKSYHRHETDSQGNTIAFISEQLEGNDACNSVVYKDIDAGHEECAICNLSIAKVFGCNFCSIVSYQPLLEAVVSETLFQTIVSADVHWYSLRAPPVAYISL